MQNRQLLALVVLVLALAGFLVRWSARGAGRSSPAAADGAVLGRESGSVPLLSLAPDPEGHGAAPANSAPAGPARASIEPAPPPRARIRGQVVVEGTREPVRESLSIRLRSLDLTLVDPLETLADGSFLSSQVFPRGAVLARVRTSGGEELVDHEALFDPESPDPWLVPVATSRWPTSVRGRVVDLSGEPQDDAVVAWKSLVERRAVAGEVWRERTGIAGTREDGRFEIDGLEPGSYELQAIGRHVRARTERTLVRRGTNAIGELVLPSPGPLSGCLVADTEPRASFFLRDRATGSELPVLDQDLDETDDGCFHFRIGGLPDGEYELLPVPRDGRVYEPAGLQVRPPAEGLVFRAVAPASPACELLVRDARSGEELQGFHVFTRVSGRWFESTPVSGGGLQDGPRGDRWLVLAEDHRPASVDLSAPCSPETPVVVELEPGWGQLRLYQSLEVEPALGEWFDAPTRAPLTGVQVLADGVQVATSGEDGMAVVSLERKPARLDQRCPGWQPAGCRERGGMLVLPMTRETAPRPLLRARVDALRLLSDG